MRKTERDFSGTAERERDVRQPMADEKPRDAPTSRVSVAAYSLASQRRATAYRRGRWRSFPWRSCALLAMWCSGGWGGREGGSKESEVTARDGGAPRTAPGGAVLKKRIRLCVLCKTFSSGRAQVQNPPGLRRNEKTTVADR